MLPLRASWETLCALKTRLHICYSRLIHYCEMIILWGKCTNGCLITQWPALQWEAESQHTWFFTEKILKVRVLWSSVADLTRSMNQVWAVWFQCSLVLCLLSKAPVCMCCLLSSTCYSVVHHKPCFSSTFYWLSFKIYLKKIHNNF